TLQTGFAVVMVANSVFYTDRTDHSKFSSILASIAYTQRGQIIFPISANIWTKKNKYNIISDVRYMNYPSVTFGLGPKTVNESGYGVDFSYFKFHQSVLKNLGNNFYAGAGIYFDYLWNEVE